MRKMNKSTLDFINNNIKNNAKSSSYPLRKQNDITLTSPNISSSTINSSATSSSITSSSAIRSPIITSPAKASSTVNLSTLKISKNHNY